MGRARESVEIMKSMIEVGECFVTRKMGSTARASLDASICETEQKQKALKFLS